MGRLVRVLVVVVVLLAIFFINRSRTAPPAEMTQAEMAQVEAEVFQVMEEFFRGLREGDCDKAGDALHPDLTVAPYLGSLYDREGFISSWAHGCRALSWNGRWTGTDVRVLTADIAVFTGIYDLVFQLTSMKYPTHYSHGSAVALLERTENGWKATMLSFDHGLEKVHEY